MATFLFVFVQWNFRVIMRLGFWKVVVRLIQLQSVELRKSWKLVKANKLDTDKFPLKMRELMDIHRIGLGSRETTLKTAQNHLG
jgi:hypothetical protein